MNLIFMLCIVLCVLCVHVSKNLCQRVFPVKPPLAITGLPSPKELLESLHIEPNLGQFFFDNPVPDYRPKAKGQD